MLWSNNFGIRHDKALSPNLGLLTIGWKCIIYHLWFPWYLRPRSSGQNQFENTNNLTNTFRASTPWSPGKQARMIIFIGWASWAQLVCYWIQRTHGDVRAEVRRSLKILLRCTKNVHSSAAKMNIEDYWNYPSQTSPSAILIDKYAIRHNGCWIDLCGDSDIHHAKAIVIVRPRNGISQLNIVSFANAIRRERAVTNLIKENVDLLIVVLMDVYVLSAERILQTSTKEWMKKLKSIFMRSFYRINQSYNGNTRRQTLENCWKHEYGKRIEMKCCRTKRGLEKSRKRDLRNR